MAFTNPGRDLAIVTNPSNGRVTWEWDETNNPRFTDTEEHAVFGLLAEFEGEWWADSTGKRGSKLHTIKNELGQVATLIESYVRAALKPLESAGRIVLRTVKAQKLGSLWWAEVRWSRPGSQEVQTTRAPISMEQ